MLRKSSEDFGEQWTAYAADVQAHPEKVFRPDHWEISRPSDRVTCLRFPWVDTEMEWILKKSGITDRARKEAKRKIYKVLEVLVDKKGGVSVDPEKTRRSRHTSALWIGPSDETGGLTVDMSAVAKIFGGTRRVHEILGYDRRGRLALIRFSHEIKRIGSSPVLDSGFFELEEPLLSEAIEHPTADFGFRGNAESKKRRDRFTLWLKQRKRVSDEAQNREDFNWLHTDLDWGTGDTLTDATLGRKAHFCSLDFPAEASVEDIMLMVKEEILKLQIASDHVFVAEEDREKAKKKI